MCCSAFSGLDYDDNFGSKNRARMTGADIYRGSRLDFEYGRPLSDGDTFDLGDLRLKILEAPGHTFESISIAVIDTGFEAETAGYPKRLIPLLSAS